MESHLCHRGGPPPLLAFHVENVPLRLRKLFYQLSIAPTRKKSVTHFICDKLQLILFWPTVKVRKFPQSKSKLQVLRLTLCQLPPPNFLKRDVFVQLILCTSLGINCSNSKDTWASIFAERAFGVVLEELQTSPVKTNHRCS